MALLHCNFFSESLRLSVAMDVILPQAPAGVRLGGQKYPVLWLLHGMSDDHTIWQRRTSIERYAEGRNLAVIMPAVDRSFYTDMAHGNRYWTYIADELPTIARNFFPLSARREDNFVAGLSMGGYGAFKLGLNYPTRYAAAASLSGVLRRFSDDLETSQDPIWMDLLANIFGDLQKFPGTHNDLYAMAERVAKSSGPKPALYQCCGTEDFLYADNLRFKAHLEQLGLPFTYTEGPGEHVWSYWDVVIQQVLAWLPLE